MPKCAEYFKLLTVVHWQFTRCVPNGEVSIRRTLVKSLRCQARSWPRDNITVTTVVHKLELFGSLLTRSHLLMVIFRIIAKRSVYLEG